MAVWGCWQCADIYTNKSDKAEKQRWGLIPLSLSCIAPSGCRRIDLNMNMPILGSANCYSVRISHYNTQRHSSLSVFSLFLFNYTQTNLSIFLSLCPRVSMKWKDSRNLVVGNKLVIIADIKGGRAAGFGCGPPMNRMHAHTQRPCLLLMFLCGYSFEYRNITAEQYYTSYNLNFNNPSLFLLKFFQKRGHSWLKSPCKDQ